VEHYLRAIKDLLADTSPHGPYRKIIDTCDLGALGLSLALPEGYRKVMYPEMKAAYAELSRRGDWTAVEQARQTGYQRFRAERDAIVETFRTGRGKDNFAEALREMLRKAEVKK
jgi:hypothetical protein